MISVTKKENLDDDDVNIPRMKIFQELSFDDFSEYSFDELAFELDQ